jgi:hypothetical protein
MLLNSDDSLYGKSLQNMTLGKICQLRPILVKVKVSPKHAITGTRESSRGIALLKLNFSDKRGWLGNIMPESLYAQQRLPVSIVKGSGQVPGPLWIGMQKRRTLILRKVGTPDRPTTSECLH